jgi:hypothetical protein
MMHERLQALVLALVYRIVRQEEKSEHHRVGSIVSLIARFGIEMMHERLQALVLALVYRIVRQEEKSEHHRVGSIVPALAKIARTGHPQFRNGKGKL